MTMQFQKIINPVWITMALICGLSSVTLAQTEVIGTAPDPETAPTPDYKINPGDVLQVSVWREEDLQREVLVRPDGKFSFPLAGDIDARNQSVEDIRLKLTESLSRYIPDLVVSVAVLQINGNKVYVIGQVNRPGDFVVNPMVDVVQAISMAGGPTPFAEVNDIKILRRNGGELEAIEFRYRDIERGKRLFRNIVLQAGDVIVVP